MLRKATIEVLQQLADLIHAVGKYYDVESSDSSSTIGRHVRHILDHFIALKLAVNTGHVNYNRRNRDSIIEFEPNAALIQIEHLRQWILAVDFDDHRLTLESEVSLNHCRNVVVDASFYREICYVINHTVHHIAYATLIARQMGLCLDESLGIAPATATYIRDKAQCAR